MPFKTTGEIKKVVIDLTPEHLSAADGAKLKEGEGRRHPRRPVNCRRLPFLATAGVDHWFWS